MFVEMSLMENVNKKRCYIALDYDTRPHRLRIQTRIRPTSSLTETSSLMTPSVFVAPFMIMVVVPPECKHSVWIDVLPEGNIINVGVERFRCMNVLLLPNFLGAISSGSVTLLSGVMKCTSTFASCTPMSCCHVTRPVFQVIRER